MDAPVTITSTRGWIGRSWRRLRPAPCPLPSAVTVGMPKKNGRTRKVRPQRPLNSARSVRPALLSLRANVVSPRTLASLRKGMAMTARPAPKSLAASLGNLDDNPLSIADRSGCNHGVGSSRKSKGQCGAQKNCLRHRHHFRFSLGSNPERGPHEFGTADASIRASKGNLTGLSFARCGFLPALEEGRAASIGMGSHLSH